MKKLLLTLTILCVVIVGFLFSIRTDDRENLTVQPIGDNGVFVGDQKLAQPSQSASTVRPKLLEEQRKHERYDTEVKIYFHYAYDIKTKVKFQLVDKERDEILSKKYLAFSKNVSSVGLCFVSEKRLEVGDNLNLEVYLPQAEEPIFMKGEVKWSHACKADTEGKNKFETGATLISVEGQSVSDSIYYDKTYQVEWSVVLESVLGSFKTLVRKRHKEK